MNDNIFRKKILEMGKSAGEKIEKLFDGATRNAREFVDKFRDMNNKTRVKVMKQVGAGLMSLLILAGFTGCVDEKGNVVDEPSVTVTHVGEEEITVATTVVSPETQHKPVETTGPSSTSRPVETTGPAETTGPVETTGPAVTTGPAGTTGPAETTRPSESTTTTQNETTTTTPPVTTGPNEDNSPIVEDFPADEDGYAYPEFFANLVNKSIAEDYTG